MFFSYFLWSISHPGQNGVPTYNLKGDKDATVFESTLTPTQLAIEHVISKVFTHYSIPLEIIEDIRVAFKSKLYRMGVQLNKLGGKQRKQQLNSWKESVWSFTISNKEFQRQLIKRSYETELQLEQERAKKCKLEEELKELKQVIESQADLISTLSSKRSKRHKPWTQYSRQHQSKIKRQVVSNVKTTLEIACENDKFKPRSVEMENVDTRTRETLDLDSELFIQKTRGISDADKINSTILIKDKCGISNEAYHEFSMISDLPKSCQVKKNN